LWKIKRIILNESQYKSLFDISEENYPIEGCAILLGLVKEDIVVTTDIEKTINKERSRILFQVDPKIVLDIYNRADREGKEVVGVFHSHPSMPIPSMIDMSYMDVNPIIWLILSTTTNILKAFQLQDDEIKEVNVDIANPDI
jgi:proteasome lid subunit RPN8/RPN11